MELTSETCEYHLFLIWPHARDKYRAILADITQQFAIVQVFKIHWNNEKFISNLTRFYSHSQNHLDTQSLQHLMLEKMNHCGTGPFYVVVVKDSHPLYRDRNIQGKSKSVNINTYDAKDKYRTMTGGGHRIHATNTPHEFDQDIILLLGLNTQDFLKQYSGTWHGNIREIHRNITGVDGWKSLTQFFYVLNSCIDYVVLRNFECLPERAYTNEHQDLDLLASNQNFLAYLSGAEKVFPEDYRVHYRIEIKQQPIFLDCRYVGDNYYDSDWEAALISKRVYRDGFYRLDQEGYFYSLLYHALGHKPEVSKDYRNELTRIAQSIDIGISLADFDNGTALRLLTTYLAHNNYRYVRPNDLTVGFNQTALADEFGNSEIIASKSPTRKINAGFRDSDQIDLSGPLPHIMQKGKLISSRLLAKEGGIEYWSCLYDDDKAIYKQTTLDLAQREASFLSALEGKYFPKVLNSWSERKYSVVVLEKVFGEPLKAAAGDINEHPERMFHFIEDCLSILCELKEKGIVHRDIRSENILMRHGRPVLIDFGWAVSERHPYFAPKRLGASGRPPDGSFCDVYSMGKVLEQVNARRYPRFGEVIRLMTEPDVYLRMTDLASLEILCALAYTKELQHE